MTRALLLWLSLCGLAQAEPTEVITIPHVSRGFPTLVSGDKPASNAQLDAHGDHFDEEAAFFLRGLIGLVAFSIAYTVIKRFTRADDESDDDEREG